MSGHRLVALLLAIAAARTAAAARATNLYEWMAVAPVVVVGAIEVDDQRFVEVRISRALRGDLEAGSVLRVDQRRANRERLDGTPRVELRKGAAYILLLERRRKEPRAGGPIYDLVRGTAGAREVGEGGAILTEAALRLAEWQDRKNEGLLWADLARALEDPNPTLVEVALDLFLKFRRGDPALLPALRPLFDNPRPGLREKTALLAGQVLDVAPPEPSPAVREAVLALVAAARRDATVEVRVAATRALGGVEDTAAREALREISRSDPDQAVRYEAQRILVEREAPRDSAAIDLPRSAP